DPILIMIFKFKISWYGVVIKLLGRIVDFFLGLEYPLPFQHIETSPRQAFAEDLVAADFLSTKSHQFVSEPINKESEVIVQALETTIADVISIVKVKLKTSVFHHTAIDRWRIKPYHSGKLRTSKNVRGGLSIPIESEAQSVKDH